MPGHGPVSVEHAHEHRENGPPPGVHTHSHTHRGMPPAGRRPRPRGPGILTGPDLAAAAGIAARRAARITADPGDPAMGRHNAEVGLIMNAGRPLACGDGDAVWTSSRANASCSCPGDSGVPAWVRKNRSDRGTGQSRSGARRRAAPRRVGPGKGSREPRRPAHRARPAGTPGTPPAVPPPPSPAGAFPATAPCPGRAGSPALGAAPSATSTPYTQLRGARPGTGGNWAGRRRRPQPPPRPATCSGARPAATDRWQKAR